MARFINRLIDAQARWAKPFGDFNHRWLTALFRPMRPVKEFLHGRWLGTHPLHAAATDLPIGALTVAVVLEVIGQPSAAGIALIVGLLGMAASTVTGLADYTDTDGSARTKATVHATIMVVGLVVLLGSVVARAGGEAGATVAAGLLVVGYLVVVGGAYIGGDVVFALGNMVDRHAWRGRGTKWTPLDLGGVAEIPEGVPVKAKAGPNALVLVRTGSTIHALHEQCAHAGGPLSEGRIIDGCIECPWHASRFRLADGAAVAGPTLYDQPAYAVRTAEGGAGYEVRRTFR
jgi:nitrite reductase/ring-hydroxylating ferredoxin subunit